MPLGRLCGTDCSAHVHGLPRVPGTAEAFPAATVYVTGTTIQILKRGNLLGQARPSSVFELPLDQIQSLFWEQSMSASGHRIPGGPLRAGTVGRVGVVTGQFGKAES